MTGHALARPAPDTRQAGSLRPDFERDGLAGPVPAFTATQCATISRYLADARHRPRPLDWEKGYAASDRLLCELALSPALVEAVQSLIGPDVVLWGMCIVDKEPGEAHPWHTDIETSAPEPGTVTAWIGIENTSADSSLQLIRGSHRIGAPLQKVCAEHGVDREQRTAEAALRLARALLPAAELVRPHLRDGEALLFDGRTWHGSLNARARGRRRALLFQYAAAHRAIRIPDWSRLDWPFLIRESPLPPVLAVAGTPDPARNRLVPRPQRSPEQLRPLYPLVRELPWPLPGDPARGWRPHFLFRGTTPLQRQLSCHVSVLDPGHCPHPPHAHLDEELLVVLDGTAEIVIATDPDDPTPRIEMLGVGDFAYYPSFQHHTIRCTGPRPVSYLMFRWVGTPRAGEPGMQARVERARPPLASLEPGRFRSELIFEEATGLLRQLHVHWSHASRGGGYPPHRDDDHEAALVLLSGKVSTIGRTVSAPAVIFYPADTDHGLQGAGDPPAEYLVVEWHGTRPPAGEPPEPPMSWWRRKYREARFRAWRLATVARTRFPLAGSDPNAPATRPRTRQS